MLQHFGKSGNAWLKLPAISGRTLKSIKLEFQSCSGAMNVSTTVSKESGEGSKDIETKDAGKGTAYYLCVENAANVIITRMTLVYAL